LGLALRESGLNLGQETGLFLGLGLSLEHGLSIILPYGCVFPLKYLGLGLCTDLILGPLLGVGPGLKVCLGLGHGLGGSTGKEI
jgi:hypothetical protein